jgi:hypothetical protein
VRTSPTSSGGALTHPRQHRRAARPSSHGIDARTVTLAIGEVKRYAFDVTQVQSAQPSTCPPRPE